MMSNTFFLLTEPNFHASYLVTEWIQSFATLSEFGGIVLREEPLSEECSKLRNQLHREFQGCHSLTNAVVERFREVYPNLSETDIAMIKLFGVPAYSVSSFPRTTFLGKDLNSRCAWDWLINVTRITETPFFFIFLDQLLKSWWIETTHSRIVNGHSAILPYARGMYAIENIAITQDIASFIRCVGASVHYIDTGIDTGPIILKESIENPFSYDSIWEVKAVSFQKVFTLLIRSAQILLEKHQLPAGMAPEAQQRGPNFNSRNFTFEARRRAEEGYVKMKAAARQLCHS